MADENKIGLEAIFENENFRRGISEYNSDVSSSSAGTDRASDTMSTAWAGLAVVGEAAFLAIGAGVAAMTAELFLAVDAALDTEEVLARMEFVVGNVGERTGVAADDVLAMADALSKVVPIDDEVIASAITMGLTFDGVTKDNIEPLIAAAADLATWTGKDLPSTMKTLSLAISDPDKAMRLLKEANITLTDEQMKTLKGFKDTGDAAGATAFILDQLKNKGIIGLGEAMAETGRGKMTIMQTALGNLQEALGGGLLDSLKSVFDKITEFANDPKTISFFTDLGNKIGAFAESVINKLPSIMTMLEGVFTWLSENKPLIVGILAAIGVAMLAFGYTAAAAGIAAMAGLWPVVAVMLVVGAAVALLYKAWTENWGGVQQKVAKAWAQMKPTFDKLQEWLKVNLPKAIKALSDFWEKTLLPAIKTVFTWIVDNVIPILVDLVLWLGDNVPRAIKTLSDFWTKTLLPAIKTVADYLENTVFPILASARDWFQIHVVNSIKALVSTISGTLNPILSTLSGIWTGVLLPAMAAVSNFINSSIMPLFNALAGLLDAVVGLAVRVLAGLWQNVLWPALSAVWSFINSNLLPIFNTVANVINGVLSSAITGLSNLWRNTLQPAIQSVWDRLSPFASFLSGTLYNAFNSIKNVVQWVIDRIHELTNALNNLTLPDWLTPGSPTPFEIGLVGINEQLSKLAQAALPAVLHQMEVLATVRDVSGGSTGSTMAGSVSNSNQSTRNYLFGSQFNVSGKGGFLETLQGL
jgi:phage-related protein